MNYLEVKHQSIKDKNKRVLEVHIVVQVLERDLTNIRVHKI